MAYSAVSSTASRPFLPVKAFEFPEFTTSARALPDFRLSRHQSTGAEQVLDCVSTPAATVPSSMTAIMRSFRFLYLMPASHAAKRTPSMTGTLGRALGANGDTAASALAMERLQERNGSGANAILPAMPAAQGEHASSALRAAR